MGEPTGLWRDARLGTRDPRPTPSLTSAEAARARAREATDTPAVVAMRCTATRKPWGLVAGATLAEDMVARRAMAAALGDAEKVSMEEIECLNDT